MCRLLASAASLFRIDISQVIFFDVKRTKKYDLRLLRLVSVKVYASV